MSCAEIIPKLELMADDELSSEQAANVLSHIDECAPCRDSWYDILALRQAIKDRAASFTPSADFEEKIINAVRKEAWQSSGRQTRSVELMYAAGLLAVGVVVALVFTAVQAPHKNGKAENVLAVTPSKIDSSGAKPEQQGSGDSNTKQATSTDSKPHQITAQAASLEDALSNFKQYLETKAPGQSAAASPENLSKLSDQAGFAVKPMQLNGFKLAGASLVSTAPGRANMVRFCYKRKKGSGSDSIICYQAATGQLVAKGLAEHMIGGRKICCGQVEDQSIVFIPGQKGITNETLLVGNVSKSDLMDLALSSS